MSDVTESKDFVWSKFWSFPAIGIMRGFECDLALEISQQAFQSGLVSLEVTLNTPHAAKQISLIKKYAPDGVHVGAGTVISLQGLDEVLEAGAQFIVTPTVQVDVIKYCADHRIPVFPGAFTPTEVLTAWDSGASAVKLFPVGVGGPSYVKSVKAPLDHIPLLAVDGVNPQNILAYIDAGASGVGLGGQLFEQSKMIARNWQWMDRQIQVFRSFWPSENA